MTPPAIPVGFDYSLAVLHILKQRTYEQLAAHLGYESVGSISKLIDGATPPHPVGEAIYVLYVHLFQKKPPMTAAQAEGVPDLHLSACVAMPSTV